MIDILVFIVNTIAILTIMGMAICTAGRMTPETIPGLRVGYVLLAVGTFGAIVAPFFGAWPHSTWQNASIHSGVAAIMFFSRGAV